jgi:hypothetical protein
MQLALHEVASLIGHEMGMPGEFGWPVTCHNGLHQLHVTMAYISDRIIKSYIMFHKQCNTEWDPTAVTHQTPYDVRAFIGQKCGEKEKGHEGKRACLPLHCCSCMHLTSHWPVLDCCFYPCCTQLLVPPLPIQ